MALFKVSGLPVMAAWHNQGQTPFRYGRHQGFAAQKLLPLSEVQTALGVQHHVWKI